MFPSFDVMRLGGLSARSPVREESEPRVSGPAYAAMLETFGPALAAGWALAPGRIMGSEAGRSRVGEVLRGLGFPVMGTDRGSIGQGLAALQRAAGLPETGRLDVGTLAVMSLAYQRAQVAINATPTGGPVPDVPLDPVGASPSGVLGHVAPNEGGIATPTTHGATPVAPSTTTPGGPTNTVGVTPIQQHGSRACGQASVAMAVSALTGRKVTEAQIASRYGYGLLGALNAESGRAWKDYGNLEVSNVRQFGELLDRKVNQEKTPVIIGLGGTFTASGYGHIVTIVGYDKASGKVSYADPADGKIKQTTLQYMASQPPHHDGRFVFATR